MALIDYYIIVITFIVFGVLLYIPCHWLIKRKIRNINPNNDFMLRITSSGLALITLMTVALFLGLSQEHFAPDTSFGRFISSVNGKIYYIILVWILTFIFGLILQKLGYTLFRRSDDDDK